MSIKSLNKFSNKFYSKLNSAAKLIKSNLILKNSLKTSLFSGNSIIQRYLFHSCDFDLQKSISMLHTKAPSTPSALGRSSQKPVWRRVYFTIESIFSIQLYLPSFATNLSIYRGNMQAFLSLCTDHVG